MVLENKLRLTSDASLAEAEERLSKQKAIQLFDEGILDNAEAGTFNTLALIHCYLFEEVYDFAGKRRTVNLAKCNFRFASVMYLDAALQTIEAMPQDSFDAIIEKYVEMNIAYPFREGKGRSMRLWLDHLLKQAIGQVIDWQQIDKQDYLQAIMRSPINDLEIKTFLRGALTTDTDSRETYMKGIDQSYHYEGYHTYRAEDL